MSRKLLWPSLVIKCSCAFTRILKRRHGTLKATRAKYSTRRRDTRSTSSSRAPRVVSGRACAAPGLGCFRSRFRHRALGLLLCRGGLFGRRCGRAGGADGGAPNEELAYTPSLPIRGVVCNSSRTSFTWQTDRPTVKAIPWGRGEPYASGRETGCVETARWCAAPFTFGVLAPRVSA